jgi:hypothetical protein
MFTWTEEMGTISLIPAHEKQTRAAVIAACEHYQALAKDAERPRFAGSMFVVPQNQAARDLVAACMKEVTQGSGIEMQTILATAVGAAQHFVGAGAGEAGWAAVGKLIISSRSARGQRRRSPG